jgi:hypothetical protein
VYKVLSVLGYPHDFYLMVSGSVDAVAMANSNSTFIPSLYRLDHPDKIMQCVNKTSS